MKKFLFQFSIFSISVIIFWLFIFLLDPSNFSIVSKIINKDTKPQIINRLYEMHIRKTAYWDLYQFQYNPCCNIIISDSKGKLLNLDLINELTGNRYINLNIQGCNAGTKFNIFWFAVTQTKLNHVVIQLDFGNWIMNKKDMFNFEQNSTNKSLLNVLKSTISKDLYFKITHSSNSNRRSIDISILKFPMTYGKNKLLYSYLQEGYQNYRYPVEYIEELKAIVNYCKKNKISLEFLVLPSHQLFYDNLSRLGIFHYYQQFLTDISSLAIIYNYSLDPKINREENNFIDYFHPNQLITDSITRLVWGKN